MDPPRSVLMGVVGFLIVYLLKTELPKPYESKPTIPSLPKKTEPNKKTLYGSIHFVSALSTDITG